MGMKVPDGLLVFGEHDADAVLLLEWGLKMQERFLLIGPAAQLTFWLVSWRWLARIGRV